MTSERERNILSEQTIPPLYGRSPAMFALPELRGEVFYTYSAAQQSARAAIIDQLDAEKLAYLERCEPLVKRLADIEATATPHFVMKSAPR